jgi:putative membrane protein
MNKSPGFLLMVGSILSGGLILMSCSSTTDSVAKAKEQTEAINPGLNEKDARFLIEMTDARMMDIQEGQLAVERGTKMEIRNYGTLMVEEQDQLLQEIKLIADAEKVVLPAQISADKAEALDKLKSLKGKKFDKKFISMISIDHERDAKEFKRVAENTSNDYSAIIKDFAAKRAPMILNHLTQINDIEAHYNTKKK